MRWQGVTVRGGGMGWQGAARGSDLQLIGEVCRLQRRRDRPQQRRRHRRRRHFHAHGRRRGGLSRGVLRPVALAEHEARTGSAVAASADK